MKPNHYNALQTAKGERMTSNLAAAYLELVDRVQTAEAEADVFERQLKELRELAKASLESMRTNLYVEDEEADAALRAAIGDEK